MDGCKGKKKYRSVLRFVTATLIWSMLLETSAGGISAAELSFFEEEALNVTETGTESLPAETDEYGNQTATYAPVFADLPAADGEQTAQEDLPESIPDSALEVTWQEEELAETGETSDRGELAETGEISEWDSADIGENDDEITLDRDLAAEDVGTEYIITEGEESEDTGQEAPTEQGEAGEETVEESLIEQGESGGEAGEESPEEQGEAGEEAGEEPLIELGEVVEEAETQSPSVEGEAGEKAGTESTAMEGEVGEEAGTEAPEDQREGIERLASAFL